MALDITLSVAIASDRESFVITDSTVYGTGGNPARAAVAVYVSSYKMNADNTVADTLTVTGDDDDPETDSSWSVNYTVDGWYKTYFVAIPDYAVSTYAIYDAVYSAGVVYRSKQNGNSETDLSNTTWWEVIADPSTLANNKDTSSESLNINSLVYQRILSADSQYQFANDVADQCGCDCEELVTLQKYLLFRMLLDNLAIADSRSEVIDGETTAIRIESNFINC